jgi:RNA-directed DNA polymerase
MGNRLASHGGESYQWVLEGDRASSFDTLPHRRFIKAVKKRGADRKSRALLWQCLRAGVMDQGKVQETLTGTPQGGTVSPLLAHLYLHALDRSLESTYLHLSAWERSKRRKAGQSNFLYGRYADDCVGFCNGTKAQAIALQEELQALLDQMG